jgi:hypothetical protein
MGRREMAAVNDTLRHTSKKTISKHHQIRVVIPELRDTRQCQSTQEYCLAETRSAEEMSTSPPLRTAVIGRRQERMMRKQVSDNWDSSSVDSGVGSDFSSSRSTLNSIQLSRQSSMESMDRESFCDTSNIYSTVSDNTILDNTYASIHTVDTNLAPRVPPKLPPRNKKPMDTQQNKYYLNNSLYSNISTSTSSEGSNDVIVSSRFHTYTVDDIVDSYFSLVSDIPKDYIFSPKNMDEHPSRAHTRKYSAVYL